MSPALLLSALSDCLQVLKRNSSAWLHRLDDELGEDVIVVSALPKLFPTQLLKVSPGRTGAFSFQGTTQAKNSLLAFSPAALSQELILGRDSRMGQP